jgi:DNA-binding NarL/FixJ family response regulator
METYFQCAYMATQQAAWYDVLIDWSWVTDDPYDDATLAKVHRIRDRRRRQAQRFNDLVFHLARHFDTVKERHLPISSDDCLSPRELEVLALVAEGLSDKTVGDRLSIARSTVKGHMVSISAKLGQTGRVGIVMEALRRGLIEVRA